MGPNALWHTQPNFWVGHGLLFSAPMESGERCKLRQRGPGRSPDRSRILLAKRIWLQNFWFFGQHRREWQNESQSRFRSNLICCVATNAINDSRSNWQVNFCRVQNCAPPPKFCGPVRPNTSNMPKAGPDGPYSPLPFLPLVLWPVYRFW